MKRTNSHSRIPKEHEMYAQINEIIIPYKKLIIRNILESNPLTNSKINERKRPQITIILNSEIKNFLLSTFIIII